jgi:hypothetical protein
MLIMLKMLIMDGFTDQTQRKIWVIQVRRTCDSSSGEIEDS